MAAYLKAYNDSLGGYYHVDLYAGDPALEQMKANGLIKYDWRPNANSWSGNDGLPYQPSQDWIKGNMATILAKTGAAIWQNGNYWYSKGADENVLLRPQCGSHLQAESSGPGVPDPAPPPHEPKLRRAWPSYMKPGDYFGLITGPAHSRGGYYASEKRDVLAIQKRLQVLGYAPSTPGWADGIFEQPTANAVAAWQRAHVPGTQFYGQVWQDDWANLFTY